MLAPFQGAWAAYRVSTIALKTDATATSVQSMCPDRARGQTTSATTTLGATSTHGLRRHRSATRVPCGGEDFAAQVRRFVRLTQHEEVGCEPLVPTLAALKRLDRRF